MVNWKRDILLELTLTLILIVVVIPMIGFLLLFEGEIVAALLSFIIGGVFLIRELFRNLWAKNRGKGLTRETREFYREFFGIHPIVQTRYFHDYELNNDEILYQEGIKIGAEVFGIPIFRGKVNICFSRGEKFVRVGCTHTILNNKGKLRPWEEFAALKSYVGAIAEFGLLNLLSEFFRELDQNKDLSFGFNHEMQKQIFDALDKIGSPHVSDFLISKMLEGWLGNQEIIEWFQANKRFIGKTYKLSKRASRNRNILEIMNNLEIIS